VTRRLHDSLGATVLHDSLGATVLCILPILLPTGTVVGRSLDPRRRDSDWLIGSDVDRHLRLSHRHVSQSYMSAVHSYVTGAGAIRSWFKNLRVVV
jgi:hypothetical protein